MLVGDCDNTETVEGGFGLRSALGVGEDINVFRSSSEYEDDASSLELDIFTIFDFTLVAAVDMKLSSD